MRPSTTRQSGRSDRPWNSDGVIGWTIAPAYDVPPDPCLSPRPGQRVRLRSVPTSIVCSMPTLRNLAVRKLRLFTTTLAVLAGIGFVAGTLILNDPISRTFDELLADLTGNAFGIRSSWDMSGH